MDQIDQDVDLSNNEAPEETQQPEQKETKERAPETPEARVARLKRQLEREERKLGIAKEEPEREQPKSSDELDWGQKAFLRTSGIKGSDELALVKTWMKRTGDDIDTLVDDDLFQAKLKQLREKRDVQDALPTNSKRSNTSTRDKVDYWLSKGEMPPADMPELRREYVNARIQREKNGGKFSSNSVVKGF